MYLIPTSLHCPHYWLSISTTHPETFFKKPNAMPSILSSVGQFAFATLIIICVTAIGPLENLQLIGVYLHQAFWCCVIETAVGCPAEVIKYFMRSKSSIPPRILQRLDPFIAFLWCEMTAHIIAQSVQPFIVLASLSPSVAMTSTTTKAPWGILAQCMALLCFLQIIHSVSLFVRGLQSELQCRADDVLLNVHAEEAPINRLHILSAVHEIAGRLFTTAALYLERIATGILVTSLTIAHENLDGPEYWKFTAATVVLLLGAHAYAWGKALEWDADGRELVRDRLEERQGSQQTAFEETINRLCLRCIWVFDAWLQRVTSWRVSGLGRWWCCPELVALWPEPELRQLYINSLSGFPPPAIMAPWSYNSIHKQHMNLWRRAGLTRDLVLRDHSASPIRVPTEWLGHLCFMVLGRIIVVLVWFLEVAFAWFFSLALAMACALWNEQRRADLKLRRA